MRKALFSLSILLVLAGAAMAQQPGVVTGGAAGVTIDGKPAARQGDTATDGQIVQGSSNVFINGKPAVTAGDGTSCGGVITSGSKGVFINGKPMARAGDPTSGCPGKYR